MPPSSLPSSKWKGQFVPVCGLLLTFYLLVLLIHVLIPQNEPTTRLLPPRPTPATSAVPKSGISQSSRSGHERVHKPEPAVESSSSLDQDQSPPLVEIFHQVRFWITTSITEEATQRKIRSAPGTPRTVALVSNLPGPDREYPKNTSLGHYSQGIVFCEFWSVSLPVFLLDCLPRLVQAVPYLRRQGHLDSASSPTSSSEWVIFCPGEFFAFQYLVEVLHLSERQIRILPHHLMWEFKYPRYYITLEKLVYLPPLHSIKDSVHIIRTMLLPHLRTLPSPQEEQEGQLVRHPRVIFTERCDLTMPHDHSTFASELQAHLSKSSILFQTGRLETLSVTKQLTLLQSTNVLLGPSGWGNFMGMLFLPTPKSTEHPVVVMELFGTQSGVLPMHSSDVHPFSYMSVADELMRSPDSMDSFDYHLLETMLPLQKLPVANEMTRPVTAPYIFNSSSCEFSLVCYLAKLLHFHYLPIFPTQEYTARSQPIFDAKEVSEIITTTVKPRTSARRAVGTWNQSSPLFLSRPLLGCEYLFHKSKYPSQNGIFTHVYLTPEFTLILPRTGDWKRLTKEMIMLRNMTEHELITPPVSLCFQNPTYAQALVGQVKVERLKTPREFFIFMAGFLRMWKFHETLGAFFFYCDPRDRRKNWGISRDGRDILQVFELDAVMQIVPGVMCAEETDCGCEFTTVPACVEGRCMREGMLRKINKMVHWWLKALIRLYTPLSLTNDPATQRIHQHIRNQDSQIQCEVLVKYLEEKAPQVISQLPPCAPGEAISIDFQELNGHIR